MQWIIVDDNTGPAGVCFMRAPLHSLVSSEAEHKLVQYFLKTFPKFIKRRQKLFRRKY